MILHNIKSKQKDSGFTIVELLVVIVVIGILAAITIVSYTGVTTRANASKTLANAQAVVSVAESIQADTDAKYPITTGEFGTLASTSRIPAGLVISGTVDPIISTGTTNFRLYTSTTAGATKGGKLVYWDYATGALSTNATSLYWGAAKSTDTFANFG